MSLFLGLATLTCLLAQTWALEADDYNISIVVLLKASDIVDYCVMRVSVVERVLSSLGAVENPHGIKADLQFALQADIPQDDTDPDSERVTNGLSCLHEFISGVDWAHGSVKVGERGHVGSLKELWEPSSETNYLLLLTSAERISPFALDWLHIHLSMYREGFLGLNSHRIAGISLRNPSELETISPTSSPTSAGSQRPQSRFFFEEEEMQSMLCSNAQADTSLDKRSTCVMAMQRPQVSGVMYFPTEWDSMIAYVEYRRRNWSHNDGSYTEDQPIDTKQVHIPHSATNFWGPSPLKFLYEYFWLHGLYLVYPSFASGGSLAVSTGADPSRASSYYEAQQSRRPQTPELRRWQQQWQGWGVDVLIRPGEVQSTKMHMVGAAVKPMFVDMFGRLVRVDVDLLNSIAILSNVQASLKRPPKKERFQSEIICPMFSQATSDYTSSGVDGITILASTMSRFDILVHQLAHFSASTRVRRIVVVLHDVRLRNLPETPHMGLLGDTEIVLEAMAVDSLNNRFSPSQLITTDAVLIIDDDMRIALPDLHLLHEAWKNFPHHITGFAPRWFDFVEVTRKGQLSQVYLRYIVESGSTLEEFRRDKPVADIRKTGYGLMLTKVMMLHRNYLHSYVCHSPRYGLLDMVDRNNNCEDIAMNLIVALNLDKRPAPLFVYPLHPVVDYGRMRAGGLSGKKRHAMTRTKCLNAINDRYRQLMGGHTLPVQHHVVRTAPLRGNVSVGMKLDVLLGRPRRVHVDCANVSAAAGVHCMWEHSIGARFDGPSFEFFTPVPDECGLRASRTG